MKKVAAVVLTLLLLTFSSSAQEFNLNQPVFFGEFGNMSLDGMNSLISSLAVETIRTPNAKALVRIYGSERNSTYFRGSWIKSLWIANRKIAPEKLLIQICNAGQEPLSTKLFIVRETDRVDVCAEDLSAPTTTTLFSTVSFGMPDFEIVPMEETMMYVDAQAQGEYSRFAQEALKRSLSISPRSRVYLVGYLETGVERNFEGKEPPGDRRYLDKKPLAAKMLRAAKDNLIKNGFSPSQIKTVEGGYLNDSRRVEYWFVPAGGAIPKPSPEYIPKKRK